MSTVMKSRILLVTVLLTLLCAACGGEEGATDDDTDAPDAGGGETDGEDEDPTPTADETDSEAEEGPEDWEILPLEEVANYSGDDRRERLIWQAQEEGSLMVYTTLRAEDIELYFETFLESYPELEGIDLEYFRGGAEEITQRSIQEFKAGVHTPDVYSYSTDHIQLLYDEGAIADFVSPESEALEGEWAENVGPGWIPARVIIFTGAYNTDNVDPSELPTSYEELIADDTWAGRVAVESADDEWYGALYEHWGPEKTAEIFQGLKDLGVQAISGHTALTELTAAGQVDISLTNFPKALIDLRDNGASIEMFHLDPVVYNVNGAGLSANAGSPAAGMLFVDWLGSKAAGELFASMGDLSVYPGVGDLDAMFEGGDLTLVPIGPDIITNLPEYQPDWEEYILR